MSATNRGTVRNPHDYYGTPAWCVRRIVESGALPMGWRWLEPSAGDGAIIRAVNESARLRPGWLACELRDECRAPLVATGAIVAIGDFLGEPQIAGRFACAILNPPFSDALAFVQRCLTVADTVCALLRLNWLEGDDRAPWLREHAPDVYVLPNRPSFTGEGTDATAYAWMVWPSGFGHDRIHGKISVLPSTSVEERNADARQLGLFPAAPVAAAQPSLPLVTP